MTQSIAWILFGMMGVATSFGAEDPDVFLKVLTPEPGQTARGVLQIKVSAADLKSQDGSVAYVQIKLPDGTSRAFDPSQILLDTTGFPEGSGEIILTAVAKGEGGRISAPVALSLMIENQVCRAQETEFFGWLTPSFSKYVEIPIVVSGTDHPGKFVANFVYRTARYCHDVGVDLISPEGWKVSLNDMARKERDDCVIRGEVPGFAQSGPVSSGRNSGIWKLGLTLSSRVFVMHSSLAITQDCSTEPGSWDLSGTPVKMQYKSVCSRLHVSSNGNRNEPINLKYEGTHPIPDILEVSLQRGSQSHPIRRDQMEINGGKFRFQGQLNFTGPVWGEWKLCARSLDGQVYSGAQISSWTLGQLPGH